MSDTATNAKNCRGESDYTPVVNPPDAAPLYLLFLFAKSDQENLSDEQKALIARWVDAIKKEKK